MNSFEDTQKFAKNIFRLLKVTELSLFLGKTNKGDLSIKFVKDTEDFEIILDAVPLRLGTGHIDAYDYNELRKIIKNYSFAEKLVIAEKAPEPIIPIQGTNNIQPEPVCITSTTDSTTEPKKRVRPSKAK